MTKIFYIKSDEIENLTKAIQSIPPSVPKVLEQALYEIAQPIFQESQKLVPVDTGTLRNSGVVHAPKREGNETSITISYGGPAKAYALIVHENLYARHEPPTQAKYLETPLYRHIPILIKNLTIVINDILRNGLKK